MYISIHAFLFASARIKDGWYSPHSYILARHFTSEG